MAAWRTLASVVVTLAAVQTGWAESYSLTETPKVGDCYRIHLDMTLSGEIRVIKDNKPASLKLEAKAVHDFPERILVVSPKGMPQKTARYYETAQAKITVGGDVAERTLRNDRRLLIAQRYLDQSLIYNPVGQLLREEVELTSEHFDTIDITGLLPGQAVPVGETWKVPNAIVQALCNFEGLTSQDLTCKLEEVKDDIARVSFSGPAAGIDLGAMAKLTISGTYRFDLQQHRLVSLEWKQQDDREQGPVSPATKVESTTTLTRTLIDQPTSLSDVALLGVPDGFEPPPSMTQLYYRDPKGRFETVFGREWQVVGQTPEHLILRLMDRGDFVAQATITPWTKADPGNHLSAEAFRSAMAKTTGWEQAEELQAGVVPSEGGRWTYRISAVGKMDGIKVMQNFYLVAGANGDQVVLAFTMTQAQAEKLGTRDLSIAGSIDFPKKP